MFNECDELKSLPDISQWNTKNVTNLSHMFNKCNYLKSLPDISKWNTKNVDDMSYMFSCCCNLTFLPNILKWNLNKVNNMNYMFSYCYNIKTLPDSFGCNKDVTYKTGLFEGCGLLKGEWPNSILTNNSFTSNNLTLVFQYLGNSVTIQCKSEEKISDVFKRFSLKFVIDPKNHNFYFNSIEIKKDCQYTLEELGLRNFSTFCVVCK